MRAHPSWSSPLWVSLTFFDTPYQNLNPGLPLRRHRGKHSESCRRALAYLNHAPCYRFGIGANVWPFASELEACLGWRRSSSEYGTDVVEPDNLSIITKGTKDLPFDLPLPFSLPSAPTRRFSRTRLSSLLKLYSVGFFPQHHNQRFFFARFRGSHSNCTRNRNLLSHPLFP